MPTTQERVTKIVAEQLGVPEVQVKPESSFVADLRADSLEVVELCMAVEDEFGVEIPDEEAHRFQTVAEVVAWLDRHEAAKTQAPA